MCSPGSCSRARRARAPKARVLHVLRGSWPALAVAFTYLGAHTLLGYGTLGADVYADPISSPSAWLSWAKLRLPKLATAALWGVPASTIHVFRHPGAQWWNERVPCETPMEFHVSHALFALVGLAVAALALILARAGMRPDERRALRVVLVGAGLGLVPISVRALALAPADRLAARGLRERLVDRVRLRATAAGPRPRS